MWIFLNDAFLSAVEHRNDPNLLLVRARVSGDLQRVFPDLAKNVQKTTKADYRFRLAVDRTRFMEALNQEVGRIDYGNFKKSVKEFDRHEAYLDVWSAMYGLQQDRAVIDDKKGK